MRKVLILTLIMTLSFGAFALAGSGKIPHIETTDTEIQEGYSFGLNANAGGGNIIADLIETYGSDATVYYVLQQVLAKLGAEYDEAVLQAELTTVKATIEELKGEKTALELAIADLNEDLAALDPENPDYASLKADLESAINAKQDAVNGIDGQLYILGIDKTDLEDIIASGGASTTDPYFQENLNGFIAEMALASPEVLTSTIGEYASASAITINDSGVDTVDASWGNTFAGAQYPGRYKFKYATDSSQLVVGDLERTEARDYSYEMAGGLVTVNVAVSTRYKGFSYAYISPVVLDLDGNGQIDASGGTWLAHDGFIEGAKTAMFDINGDSFDDIVEWVGPNDGILIKEDNIPGIDGRDFFGNHNGFDNGFEELSLLDVNKDNVLTGEELSGLKVWVDKNGDAKATPSEIKSLSELGITEITVSCDDYYVSSFVQNGERKYSFDWWPSYMDIQKTAVVEIVE